MLQYHSQPNKLEYLDISLIRTDGGTQSRASLNSKVIDEYAQALAEGKELPPVTVFYDGNTYWLADGFHRLEAAKKISSQTIAVDVRQGTRREAVLYSVGANAIHGLRRSNIDKRRSVLTLLSDAEWSKWSNSQIAKQCAVDEGLVRKLKAELTSDNTKLEPTYAKKCGVDEATLKEVEQNIEAQTSERTVCRQGTTYTLNATNIGKHGKQTFTTNETTPFKENFEAKSVKTSSTSTPFGIQLENQCEPKTINRLNQVSGKQNSSDPGQAERLLNGEVMVQPESSRSTEFVVGDDLQSKNYVEEGVQVQCELENLFFIADSKEQKPQRMGRINKILEMNEDIIKVVVDHVDMQTYMDNLQSLSGLKHRGVTVWFTGLSGAGKSTISQMVGKELRMQGYKVEILDGDVVRQNLSKGLGFSREDRDQNVRRIGFVADLLTRNGVIVLVSVISPYCETRQEVRQQIGDFVEVYVNAPLEVCEQRDVKGLYKKAREGKIKNFTGIDDLYEPPLDPEVECRTDLETPMESTLKVLAKLKNLGL